MQIKEEELKESLTQLVMVLDQMGYTLMSTGTVDRLTKYFINILRHIEEMNKDEVSSK